MTWLSLLAVLLKLVAYVARRAEKIEIERAVLNELEILQTTRVRAADTARDDIISGRVPEQPDDPNRRD